MLLVNNSFFSECCNRSLLYWTIYPVKWCWAWMIACYILMMETACLPTWKFQGGLDGKLKLSLEWPNVKATLLSTPSSPEPQVHLSLPTLQWLIPRHLWRSNHDNHDTYLPIPCRLTQCLPAPIHTVELTVQLSWHLLPLQRCAFGRGQPVACLPPHRPPDHWLLQAAIWRYYVQCSHLMKYCTVVTACY